MRNPSHQYFTTWMTRFQRSTDYGAELKYAVIIERSEDNPSEYDPFLGFRLFWSKEKKMKNPILKNNHASSGTRSGSYSEYLRCWFDVATRDKLNQSAIGRDVGVRLFWNK